MKFLKLTKFKTNPELVKELADKISGTADTWQTLDYAQYPSIMQMLSDNNIVNVREINVSTKTGPVTSVVGPINEFSPAGEHIISPFRVYIPLSGVNPTYTIGDESMTIDSPIAATADEEMTVVLPEGTSYMLRITMRDAENVGGLRFITGASNKMQAFAKFFGLV